MKLYLISQDENRDYDTYDSAVVAAPTRRVAQSMNPNKYAVKGDLKDMDNCWTSDPRNVSVRYLGKAASSVRQGVICASFNAV